MQVTCKRCPRCTQVLPAGLFVACPSRPDGLGAYCKACNAAAKLAWLAANPDRRTAGAAADKARRRAARDSYVRRLVRKTTGLPASEITAEQIEARRAKLLSGRSSRAKRGVNKAQAIKVLDLAMRKMMYANRDDRDSNGHSFSETALHQPGDEG
jgi:hypothetical protein